MCSPIYLSGSQQSLIHYLYLLSIVPVKPTLTHTHPYTHILKDTYLTDAVLLEEVTIIETHPPTWDCTRGEYFTRWTFYGGKKEAVSRSLNLSIIRA